MWKSGSVSTSRSSGVHRHAVRTPSTLASALPWLKIAPFGRPVVPEVNMSIAGSSGPLASSTGDPPLVGRPSSEGGQLGASGKRAGSSSTASFGRASFHTLPSSLGPNAVLTGTTIAPSRSAATWASTRSADGGQLITTRSPGSMPTLARRAAAAALLCSTSAAVIHGVSVSRSTRAPGDAAHRATQALGSDAAATRSAGSPSNPCWCQAARSSRGPDRTWSACQPGGTKVRACSRPAPSGAQGRRHGWRRRARSARRPAPA